MCIICAVAADLLVGSVPDLLVSTGICSRLKLIVVIAFHLISRRNCRQTRRKEFTVVGPLSKSAAVELAQPALQDTREVALYADGRWRTPLGTYEVVR
jgi:hypothetical protein